MSFLAKFTNTNPRARLNFSWERSTRRLLEIVRHQYKDTHQEDELPPRGLTAEQALVALLLKDPSIKKLSDAVKEGHEWFAAIEAALDEDEREDKKSEKPAKPATKPAAQASAAAAPQVTPAPTPAAPAARPAWPNN